MQSFGDWSKSFHKVPVEDYPCVSEVYDDVETVFFDEAGEWWYVKLTDGSFATIMHDDDVQSLDEDVVKQWLYDHI